MNAPRIKVCGLKRKRDIARVLDLGADFCGVIVYEKSPRGVSAEKASQLALEIPQGKRVLVDVAPSPERLEAHKALGFDVYQIHFDPQEVAPATVAQWSRIAGRQSLWLAPRIAQGASFPECLLDMADSFLIDAFHAGLYGGSGQVGDWGFFARQHEAFPEKRWILAGGLNPQNIAAALAATGTEFVDVNSGVEVEPGVKDHAKLEAFFKAARGE